MSKQSDWIQIRRILWDDDEYVLVAGAVKATRPMRLAGDIEIQPSKQYICANSFRQGSTRKQSNLEHIHTLVIESDEIPPEQQRKLWEDSDMPHSLRVFSGGKSIHVFIRLSEPITRKEFDALSLQLRNIFPKSDPQVLRDPARLCRTPGGIRSGGAHQVVEYIGIRVCPRELKKWICDQDVIKGHRDIDTKNIVSSRISPASPSSITLEVRLMREAWEQYAQESPDRVRLYKQLILRRYKAASGHRNKTLVTMMAFLFEAVCKEIALEFAQLFYETNARAFNDPISQHMKEAESMWNARSTMYPASLSKTECEWYLAIDAREQVFFRVIRNFSLRKDKGLPVGTLVIPMKHWGYRLGLHATQVSRLIDRFICPYDILAMDKQGTRSKALPSGKLQKGEAGIYRWLL